MLAEGKPESCGKMGDVASASTDASDLGEVATRCSPISLAVILNVSYVKGVGSSASRQQYFTLKKLFN